MLLTQGNRTARQNDVSSGDEDLRMIPRWSMVLAIILFAGMQYVFHGVMPHHKHELLPWRRRVLPPATAGDDALPELLHIDELRLPLLPAVPVSGFTCLRRMPSRGQDHGRVLHPVRT